MQKITHQNEAKNGHLQAIFRKNTDKSLLILFRDRATHLFFDSNRNKNMNHQRQTLPSEQIQFDNGTLEQMKHSMHVPIIDSLNTSPRPFFRKSCCKTAKSKH